MTLDLTNPAPNYGKSDGHFQSRMLLGAQYKVFHNTKYRGKLSTFFMRLMSLQIGKK